MIRDLLFHQNSSRNCVSTAKGTWMADTPKVSPGPLVNVHVFNVSVPKWGEFIVGWIFGGYLKRLCDS
jgi:hypothetical protein